jgi:hypothetical protein
MVKCVCYTRLRIHWFRDHDATILNSSVTIGRTSLIGVGHSSSDLIVPLMLHTVLYKFIVLTNARIVCNIMVCKYKVEPTGNCILEQSIYI